MIQKCYYVKPSLKSFFVHTLVSYLPKIILAVAFISYRIGAGGRGMPGGIDDLIKVLVAIDGVCFHLLLLFPTSSCPHRLALLG